MTAAEWLAASVWAHLDENAAVEPLQVFGLVPARAGYPYAVIEDAVLRAEDAVGVSGRVGTIALVLHDGGERAERLRFLLGRVEEQMATLPDQPATDGWRLASLSLAESRIVRVKDAWRGRVIWAARMFRVN